MYSEYSVFAQSQANRTPQSPRYIAPCIHIVPLIKTGSAVLNSNNTLPLPAPKVTPPLDPAFRPAVLANHAFKAAVRSAAARTE